MTLHTTSVFIGQHCLPQISSEPNSVFECGVKDEEQIILGDSTREPGDGWDIAGVAGTTPMFLPWVPKTNYG